MKDEGGRRGTGDGQKVGEQGEQGERRQANRERNGKANRKSKEHYYRKRWH